MYIKEDGHANGPVSISPPFTYEENAEGQSEAIVKAWDNQDASWKSYLIDNIISLDEENPPENPPPEPPQESEENIIPEQDIPI